MQSTKRSETRTNQRFVIVVTPEKSGDSDKYFLVQSVAKKGTIEIEKNVIVNQNEEQGAVEHENLVSSPELATETIVSTSPGTDDVCGLELEDLRVPFMGQVVEVQEESSNTESSTSCPSSLITNEEHFGLAPSESLTPKEIQKRERDRKYKQLQRQNPEFKAQEREKARQRMHNRRMDPSYRTKERERDRKRRKQVREENVEFREKERRRDRVYKQQAKNSEKSKSSIFTRNYGKRFLYEDILCDSDSSEKCVAVRNCFQGKDCESNFLNERGSEMIPNNHLLSLHSNSSNCDKFSDSDKIENIDINFSH